MASALERYEGERKAMIADIAHELRNPLANLQLRLDALADGLVSFDDGEAKLLQGQVGLPTRLVGDLRLLSQADAGRLSLQRLPLDLSDLAENAVRQARPSAEGAGITLTFTPDEGAATVDANPDRLTQILNNLLDNALRVTPAGAGWRWRWRPPGGRSRSACGTPAPGSPRMNSKPSSSASCRVDAATRRARRGAGWASPSRRAW